MCPRGAWTFGVTEFILVQDNLRNLQHTAWIFAFAAIVTARGSHLDTIGVTVLRATTTNLNGAGVRVGQAEAEVSAGAWEVCPTNDRVTQPTNLFTYFLSGGSFTSVTNADGFPNALGTDSGHADAVAASFYGITNTAPTNASTGVATNVAHIDNYEADTFIIYYIGFQAGIPHPISERIVNQSFTFGNVDTNADQAYDDYAAQNNVLLVSGAGFRGQPVYTPATIYNGIGVGISDATDSPWGPTPDGRSKPDIVAPSPDPLDRQSSYTTPEVSGAAAILMQAGTRGDGGSDTNAATDIRTVKALLLNGAIKPADWTNSFSNPLHSRYGAGVLDVFNSYRQLAGGKRTNFVATTVSGGAAHPPTGATNTIPALNGWDFEPITSQLVGSHNDAVNHYYFNITNISTTHPAFTATITLAWNRQSGETTVNDLNLFLYNTANSNLVTCSTSLVDNVEHLYVPRLPQGRYDLQVWKAGGNGIAVSATETYALAWEFFCETAAAANAGTNVTVSWPVYPDGFVVEATTSLAPANWSTAGIPSPVITNDQNVITIGPSPGVTNRFFRLRRP